MRMLLVSPIFNRELLRFLRSKHAFGGLLLFLVVLSIAAGMCWWATLATGWATERDLLSRRLFIAITLAQLVIFSGYTLILTCTKINAEREEGTFDLLASTRLSSLHIILAKYMAALTALLLLAVASIPALSLCFLLGGVDWHDVLSAYQILFLTVLAYGMMGIACSTIFRKNYVALIAGFMLALLFYFVGGFARQLVPFAYDKSIGVFLEVTSPLGAYTEVILNAVPKSPRSAVLMSHTLFDLYLFVIALLVAWYGFRSMAGQPTRALQRDELWKAFSQGKRAKRVWFPGIANADYYPPPFVDGANPVVEREDRVLTSLRRRVRPIHVLCAGVPLLAVAGVLGRISETYEMSLTSSVGVATSILAALVATVLAATSVTREYEARTMELLAGTLLTPFEILAGKFYALYRRAFVASIAVSFVLFVLFGKWSLFALIRGVFGCLVILVPLSVIILFYASVGLFFSVMCRKSVSAIALSYATLAGLAAFPWVVATVYWIAALTVFGGDYYFEGLSFFAPLASPCLYFLPSKELNFWYANPGFGHMIGFCLLVLGISIVILAAAKARFELMLYQPPPREEEPSLPPLLEPNRR